MQLIDDFLNLFFPEVCCLCDRALTKNENNICFKCRSELPRTRFNDPYDNELVNRLKGKMNIGFGVALLYFYKSGISQKLMHLFKYKNHPEIGKMAGEWLGSEMNNSGLAAKVDMIIPVPLHRKKERKRGYNQSMYFATGLSEATGVPVGQNVIRRVEYGESQTRKTREERWKAAQKAFAVIDKKAIAGKNILLVDDVITTGATLDACGMQLIQNGAASLHVATMVIAK